MRTAPFLRSFGFAEFWKQDVFEKRPVSKILTKKIL